LLNRIIRKRLWRLKNKFMGDDPLVSQLTAGTESLQQELRYLRRELACSQAALLEAGKPQGGGDMSRKKICFVALYPYSLFNPKTGFVFGGSEVRTWLFSTGLAANTQHEISFVVFDHGQYPVETHQNVRVYAHSFYKTFMPVPSLPPVEGDWQAAKIGDEIITEERLAVYQRVDADVYIVPGVNNLSAEVTAFCQRERKMMVLVLGSDIDLSDVFYEGSQESTNYGARGDWGYYVLSHADLILSQTETQSARLKDKFHRGSVIVQNPIDLSHFAKPPLLDGARPMVLWVGKSDTVKRPEICLALAAQYPQYAFELIMNRSNEAIFEKVLQEAPPNVKIIERVPFDEIETYFARARVFVNTSVFEGFPNAFLQAGKYGVPVLSLQVDPDGLIGENRCGIMTDGNLQQLHAGLKKLMEDNEFHQICSANIKRYVHENHGLAGRVQELDQAIAAVGDVRRQGR